MNHLPTEEQRASIEREIEQRVYDATVAIFEREEVRGTIVGNGHPAAQKVAEMAKGDLRSRWRNE